MTGHEIETETETETGMSNPIRLMVACRVRHHYGGPTPNNCGYCASPHHFSTLCRYEDPTRCAYAELVAPWESWSRDPLPESGLWNRGRAYRSEFL